MTDRDKHKLMIGGAVVGGIILYLMLHHGSQPSVNAQAQPAPDATTNNYTFNNMPNSWPDGWFPPKAMPSPGDNTITVNVNGPYIGSLATQYFPLFGFVGIDTTQLYQ